MWNFNLSMNQWTPFHGLYSAAMSDSLVDTFVGWMYQTAFQTWCQSKSGQMEASKVICYPLTSWQLRFSKSPEYTLQNITVHCTVSLLQGVEIQHGHLGCAIVSWLPLQVRFMLVSICWGVIPGCSLWQPYFCTYTFKSPPVLFMDVKDYWFHDGDLTFSLCTWWNSDGK